MLPPRLLRTTWSRQNWNRFVFPSILSRLTQEEALADPALLIILANESVLGHIMAVPTTPIRPTGNGPLPHTSSARNWFIGVMARAHSGTRAADINSRRKRWTTSYFFTNSRRKRLTGCCGSWPSWQPGEGICSDALGERGGGGGGEGEGEEEKR